MSAPHRLTDHRAALYRLIDGRWQLVGAIELDEDEEPAPIGLVGRAQARVQRTAPERRRTEPVA